MNTAHDTIRSEKSRYKIVYMIFLKPWKYTLVENIPKYLQLVMFEQLKYKFFPLCKYNKNTLQ